MGPRKGDRRIGVKELIAYNLVAGPPSNEICAADGGHYIFNRGCAAYGGRPPSSVDRRSLQIACEREHDIPAMDRRRLWSYFKRKNDLPASGGPILCPLVLITVVSEASLDAFMTNMHMTPIRKTPILRRCGWE